TFALDWTSDVCSSDLVGPIHQSLDSSPFMAREGSGAIQTGRVGESESNVRKSRHVERLGQTLEVAPPGQVSEDDLLLHRKPSTKLGRASCREGVDKSS